MPYPNEHACRLRSPDEFQKDSFRRIKREHKGKEYSVIMGKLKDESAMTEQAYRYPVDTWSEDEARKHCQDHDGIEFAPASDDGGRAMVYCLDDRAAGPTELRFVGSPRNPYGTHASKGYPGGRAAWKKAWRVYMSRVKDQGPIQGTIRRVSMIAAGMKPKCALPAMSADDVEPRPGPCGPLEGKVFEKPSDYKLSQWKKPSDDNLDQKDVQLTCQDLEDIKRICLQEIAKRHACEKDKKNLNEREERAFQIEMRVVEEEDQPPKIIGHAAVFNQMSEVLGSFREAIEPGFFSGVLNDDIRGLWNHDSNYVLGRTKSGTLQVWEDEKGLAFEIVPPNTQWARDALVTMRRGDVDQMSFSFRVRPGGDSWYKDENGGVIRTLKPGGCEKLFDVSPVTFPAYPQTSAQVRAKVMELRGGGPSVPPASGGEDGSAPGQEPQPEGDGADGSARARLDVLRRRLELAELE